MVTRRDRPTDRTPEAWESWVDKTIRGAQERGEFSDLPGEGQPVRVDRNPLAADQELGFHVLKNADVLPYWMELGREAANGLAALETSLERAGEHLSRLRSLACANPDQQPDESGPSLFRWIRGGFPEWKAQPGIATLDSAEWERQHLRTKYIERAEKVDRQIRAYNDALPNDLRWLERPRLLPNAAATQVDAACPPVECPSSDDGGI